MKEVLQDLGGGGHDYAKRGLQTPSKGGPAKLYGLGVTFKKSDGELSVGRAS